DDQLLARRHAQARSVEHNLNAETLERREDRRKVFRDDVVDRDVPGCHRRKAAEARDLDVLAGDAPLATSQPLDAADREDVRADSVDLGAERTEKAAEILNMRLASSVADHGFSLRE